jgi:hypothetical protein
MGASGIQPSGSVGKDVVAGVLGAHRICVWEIVNFAERKMWDRGRNGGAAGNFPGDAGAVGSEDAMGGEAEE